MESTGVGEGTAAGLATIADIGMEGGVITGPVDAAGAEVELDSMVLALRGRWGVIFVMYARFPDLVPLR